MSITIKLSGIILLICSSTLIGFRFASKKCDYEKLLFSLLLSLKELKGKIRMKSGEIISLIPLCFDKSCVSVKGGKVFIGNALSNEDRNKLSELFSCLGMSDSESEGKKCDTYISFFEERYNFISNKNREECKLFRTLGFLSGVFLSIFLL